MTTRNGLPLLFIVPLVGLVLPGCDSPEYGRPRGGGHGGDGGNYARGEIHPPSKIDATRDLSRIDHYGPRS